MRTLSGEERERAERALLGPVGEALADVMFELALGRAPRSDEGVAAAGRLGWIDRGQRLTELGRLVKDPLREYGFWRRRDRRLPSEGQVKVLAGRRFAHKRVLEVGSGGGCNLLSLRMQDVPPREVVGVEPMPLYVQLGEVLAGMAGLGPNDVRHGEGQALPLPDQSFDVVLCYSAHQYMAVRQAVREMARVLAPGGQLIIVGNTLVPFAVESAARFARGRDLGTLKYDVVALGNTLAYELGGRRLRRDTATTTGAPIYPRFRKMRRWLADAGLTLSEHDTQGVPSGETVFVATR